MSFSVRPLADPEIGDRLLLLSFEDVARAASAKPASGKRATGAVGIRRIEELERDLAYTRENLHATIEEQQASNEELNSTNEEMQSSNEELQSTNEELESRAFYQRFHVTRDAAASVGRTSKRSLRPISCSSRP